MGTIADLVVKVRSDTSQYRSGLEDASGATGIFASSVSSGMKVAGAAVIGMTTAAIAGTGAFAVSSIKTAASFQQSMANVSAISMASESDLKRLTDVAIQMGIESAFSAQEAADAMSFLAMAGFSVEEIIGALPGTLAAAAAGQLDLATTADIVSNVLTGFRMEASEAGAIADVLAYAAANSNTNIEQLGAAMRAAAPAAAGFGFEVDETTASIGFLSDAGIQGALAGQHLKSIFTRLAAPTSKAAGALDDLGIATRDSQGEMLPFIDIVGQFEEKLAGVSPAQRDFALKNIFGAQVMGSFNVLLDQGADALGEYADEIDNSGGAAQRMADTQLNTLEGALTLIGSSIDVLKIKFGTVFLDSIQGVVEGITDFLNGPGVEFIEMVGERMGKAIQSFANFVAQLQNGVDPLTAIKVLVFSLAYNLGLVDGQFNGVLNNIHLFIIDTWAMIEPVLAAVANFVSWRDIALALGIAVGVVLLGALLSLLATIAPIIAGFALVVGIIAFVRNVIENDFLGIRTGIENAIQGIIDAWLAIEPWVQVFIGYFQAIAEDGDVLNDWLSHLPEPLQPLMQQFGETFKAISEALTDMVAWFTEKYLEIVAWVKDNEELIGAFARNVGIFFAAVAAAIGIAIAEIIEILFNFWNVLKTVLDLVIDFIMGFIKLIMQLFTGDFAGAWDTAIEIVKTAWENIKQFSIELAAWVTGWFGTTWEDVVQGWSDIWDMFKEIVATIWDNIKDAVVDKAYDIRWEVSYFINRLIEDIKGFKRQMVGAGEDLLHGLADGIMNAVSAVVDAAVNAVNNAIDAAKRAAGISSPSKVAAAQIGKPLGMGIFMGFQEATRSARAMYATEMDRTMAFAAGNTSGQLQSQPIFIDRNEFNIQASYPYREESDLKDDIRFLQLAGA